MTHVRLTSRRAVRIRAAVFFTLLLLCSCKSVPTRQNLSYDLSNASVEWAPIQDGPCNEDKSAPQKDGLYYAKYSDEGLKIHCLKIQLDAPGLKIKMLPDSESYRLRKKMASHNFCPPPGKSVAFNTTPFYLLNASREKRHRPAGICINEGAQISAPVSGYAALAFFNGRAKIFSSQDAPEIMEANYAAGGFWQILNDGKTVQFKEIRDSRTAAGLSLDGKTLYVIAVEGGRSKKSPGLTYMECAQFLKALGAQNAMEFDGGSSTQMSVNGRPVLSQKLRRRVPALMGFIIMNNE